MRPTAAALLTGLVSLLCAAAPASASSLSRSGDLFTFTAAPGERNAMTVNVAFRDGGWSLQVSDVVPITLAAGTGCVAGSATFLTCTYAAPQTAGPRVAMSGGDGDDSLLISSPGLANGMSGGDGSDSLSSVGGADVLDGGPGRDFLRPENGPGAIAPAPTRGADTLIGGEGFDQAIYDATGEPLTLTLDGRPGDTPDGDNVMPDVEDFIGSELDDVMVLSDGDQYVTAGAGNDTIAGLGGRDTIYGQDGNDVIDGGAGDDSLFGLGGDDRLIGGAGADTLRGDGVYVGPPTQGNDRIEARDGERDVVECDLGADTAILDSLDADDGGCEAVDRAVVPPPPSGTPAPTGNAFEIRSRTVTRTRTRLRIRVRCLTTTCTGRISIRTRGSRPRTIATGRYRVAMGATRTVSLKLGSTGRKRLGTRRTKAAAVRIAPSGGGRVAVRKVTVRR